MDTKIRECIDELFEDAPKTRKSLEIKEEMIANANEKYMDLLAEGYKEDDAFAVVMHSIGDVKELFKEMEREDMEYGFYREYELEVQRKKALFSAIAVGLYVFAGAVFFFFALLSSQFQPGFDLSLMGLVLAILICIAPTCMLVYVTMLTPKYQKTGDNMVEDYKERKNSKERHKEVRRAVSSIIWTLTVILYFLISFSTMAWHITWVIFLIAVCVESVVHLIFGLGK